MKQQATNVLIILSALLVSVGCGSSSAMRTTSVATSGAVDRSTSGPSSVDTGGHMSTHSVAQPVAKADKSRLQKAAELASNTWINSAPLKPADLQGKVVVVEFWTFACYNCKNTLPYVKAWDEKYRDRGLVVIGVHTPELSFERDVNNVKQAVQDYGIRYPIAVDGDYTDWNRYHVWAWPTWFIIDKEGYIRYSHIGEGDYAQSESTIRELLAEPL